MVKATIHKRGRKLASQRTDYRRMPLEGAGERGSPILLHVVLWFSLFFLGMLVGGLIQW